MKAMNKHTYATHWYYDQVKTLVLKKASGEITNAEFANQFVHLKERARWIELTNIMDAWNNGRDTSSELIRALSMDKYLENYKHNYENE